MTPEQFADLHISLAHNSIDHGYTRQRYIEGITKLATHAFDIAQLEQKKGSTTLPN